MKKIAYFRFFVHSAALVLAPVLAHATAGPPLVTDDPGTPGPDDWEINVVFTSESSVAEKRVELPLLDINYGWGERIQLKYEVPYVISKNHENRVPHRITTALMPANVLNCIPARTCQYVALAPAVLAIFEMKA